MEDAHGIVARASKSFDGDIARLRHVLQRRGLHGDLLVFHACFMYIRQLAHSLAQHIVLSKDIPDLAGRFVDLAGRKPFGAERALLGRAALLASFCLPFGTWLHSTYTMFRHKLVEFRFAYHHLFAELDIFWRRVEPFLYR